MISEKQIIEQLKRRVPELVPVKGLSAQIEEEKRVAQEWNPDLFISIDFGGKSFVLVGKVAINPSFPLLRDRISQLRAYAASDEGWFPILICPFLSPRKRKECRQGGVLYIDLSGNVYIECDGLYIEREGFENRFQEKRQGRNPFSDKASLIPRAMIKDIRRWWGVRELANFVSLDPGFVSRMIREMEKLGYLKREQKKVRLQGSKNLLDDWVGEYDFRKNEGRGYFCLAKGPSEIVEKLRRIRIPKDAEYGVSLQAGANLIAPHSVYNEVHVYLKDYAYLDYFVKAMDLEKAGQGANLVFLDPYYKHSVFYDRQEVKGLWVVSDLQLYLD
ncbi:MAG: MarR family transcriptional regulator, partial [Desulfobacteraceae bacterium]